MVPAKSRLGQNFLRDQQAIRRIVAALGDCTDRTVVEIGPGHGAITRELVPKAGRVIALEVDPTLAAALSKSNSFDAAKVRVETIDVLSFDFAAAAAAAGQKLIVVGNLPYYITSPILTKLAENSGNIDRAVLMVQREVADRVNAEPGSRDYGLLSVTVQLHGRVEALFTLSPEAFSPPPEVHSTVFRWRFAPRFDELGVDRISFIGFLRQVFALKRKTLANNLRAAGYSASFITDAFAETAIDKKARAEELSADELAALWRWLKKEGATSLSKVAPETN